MHPLIRLCVLIVLAAALPGLGLRELGLVLALQLLLLLGHGGVAVRRAAALGWRSRWLLAAIALLYLGFTPGDPIWPRLPGLSREGLIEGARRAAVILALINAVVVVQAAMSTVEFAGAIELLLRPLRILRLDSARFALRLGMALDQAGRGRAAAASIAPADWLQAAADRLLRIEREAGAGPAPALAPATLRAPPAWQWLVPAALAIGARAWMS